MPVVGATRLAWLDGYQELSPRERRSAPAVIVAIDEVSLERFGQWPWPRTLIAQLIDKLCNQGARPRPLPESLQTYLVDGDDDRGRRAPFARRQFLIAVEPRKARCTDDGHVLPQNRHQKQRKQGQTVTHPA